MQRGANTRIGASVRLLTAVDVVSRCERDRVLMAVLQESIDSAWDPPISQLSASLPAVTVCRPTLITLFTSLPCSVADQVRREGERGESFPGPRRR